MTIPVALAVGRLRLPAGVAISSAKECIDRLISEAERHALTPSRLSATASKARSSSSREIETGVELLRS